MNIARCIVFTVIGTMASLLVAKEVAGEEWRIRKGTLPRPLGQEYWIIEGDRQGWIEQDTLPNVDGNYDTIIYEDRQRYHDPAYDAYRSYDPDPGYNY